MTSNIGSQYLLDGIDEQGNISKQASDEVMNDLRAHFRPEFLNRLDEIIMFKPLTKENISGIIDIITERLNRRLADKELKLSLTDAAKQYITDHGYNPVYGARPLKRYIQKNVETMVARMILSGELSQGDTICIDSDGSQLTSTVMKTAE